MAKGEMDFLKLLFNLHKFQKEQELKEKELQQRATQLNQFVRDKADEPTKLYDKQIEIAQKQVRLQEKQAEILDKTRKVYVWIMVIALANLLIISIDLYFKYFK